MKFIYSAKYPSLNGPLPDEAIHESANHRAARLIETRGLAGAERYAKARRRAVNRLHGPRSTAFRVWDNVVFLTTPLG